MLLAGLAVAAVLLLVATALLNRRTRRRITGEAAVRAGESLRHDGGGTRELQRERARQESHAVRHVGEGGGGL